MQKTILYAVLNWGLGHATRSIPIIQYLMEQNYKLVIASDGVALSLLQKEFPSLQFTKTAPYDVSYAEESAKFKVQMAIQIPKFMAAIKREHGDCQKLCEEHQVDYIISDNRYGFYHPTIPSAFICHQLQLLYPDNRLIEKIINKSYQGFLKKFTQLWVPDSPPPNNISRRMSELPWPNKYYLGIDSRLEIANTNKVYDTLSILSGPEPQRTLLETELISKLKSKEGRHCLVRGGLNLPKLESGKIEIIELASTSEINELINSAELIICRSGYTSIMDLIKLRKAAILIPTPEQAEQEYLAKALSRKSWFQRTKQGGIKLQLNSHYKPPTSLKIGYNFAILEEFLSC